VTAPARRAIGPLWTFPIGLGLAALSLAYANEPARGVRTIESGLLAGVTLFDTALAYTPEGVEHHSERSLRDALAHRPSAAPAPLVVTKGGHFRAGATFATDGRPSTLLRHCEASRHALGVERIDLYLLHHPDPAVPIEASAGALASMQAYGLVDQIGVSNVDIDQLRRAQQVAPIAAVQNRLSVVDQRHRPMVEHCIQTGVAFLAYSPLGGGPGRLDQAGAALAEIAHRHSASPAQAALAWLLGLSPVVVPIVGATRPEHALNAAAAAQLPLTAADIDALMRPPWPGMNPEFT
jgi:aryl-alcohol dehydrogenase-like predicted oxidoreductase